MQTINLKNNDIEITEAFIEKALVRLIHGFSCNQPDDLMEDIIPSVDATYIQATDKSVIDANKNKGVIRFVGRFLSGGIWDSTANCYFSDTRDIMYRLEGTTLEVSAVCEKYTFHILNFNKDEQSFGIKLASKPAKEIAIVLNTARSMTDYIFALKDIAPLIAKHTFKDDNKDIFAKIVLAIFAGWDARVLGTFYRSDTFIPAANHLGTLDADTRMLNLTLIRAMENFTKDNGLKKEIYLITNGVPSDTQNTTKMLTLTKNLNLNIARNSRGCLDNCVKIHTFALSKGLNYLKDLAQATDGKFYEINSIYDFKKNLLTLINDGAPFDIREINEIHAAKVLPLYDPNNPHCHLASC